MQRLRRLRRSAAMRDLVAETQVRTGALIYPIFVIDGENIKEEVPSMPGVFRYSVDRLEEIVDEILVCQIGGTMLFGVPAHKDERGSEAYTAASRRSVRKRAKSCSSSPISACANTPRTGIAGCSRAVTWTTTRPCRCMQRRRWRQPERGRTWSRPPR